ncbi:MAG: hypothetical protein K9N10_07560 [Deltaproteobacteria bacterium]|nr:hypothetical protein [Deltaproteobacteria bacterium]
MNFTNIHPGIKTLLTALVLFAVHCCSPLTVKSPSPALPQERVASVVSAFTEQEKAVETLFFTGTLTLKERGSANSVQILMIADATPWAGTGACPYGRMKIELTHPWGKALIHILLEGSRVDILDFTEKRFYSGGLNGKYLSERLRVPLNPSILWSLARAFPAVLEHRSAASYAGNRITLLDREGDKVQVFDLYSSEPLPFKVSFCKENVSMVFSDFQDEGGILYARQVKLDIPEQKISLGIEIDQMRFNTRLPKAVFEMDPPGDFITVPSKVDPSEH